MMEAPPKPTESPRRKPRGCLFYSGVTALVLLAVVAVTAATTAWWVRKQIYAKPFTPTELTSQEQKVLDAKIETLKQPEEEQPPDDKTITITEKEINALLAHNTDLGDKAYVELGHNTIGARCNIPVEEDAPFLGGKTIRAKLRLRVQFEDAKLVVRVADVTLAGLSLPNAWLGGVKNVDLVEEYFAGDEVLSAFVQGIEALEVMPGKLRLVLAE